MKTNNNTPRAFGLLSARAAQNLNGLHRWGAVLGITYNSEDRMRTDWQAACLAQREHRAAITQRIDAVRAQESTRRDAFEFVMTVRDLMRRRFGTRYSERWGEVGFANSTLKIPPGIDGLLSILDSIERFYVAHVEWEVPDLATGAMAADLHIRLRADIRAVLAAWSEQRQKKDVRESAVAALRLRVQRLYAELKQVMSKDDPRWFEFGFNIPGDVKPLSEPEQQAVPVAETSASISEGSPKPSETAST